MWQAFAADRVHFEVRLLGFQHGVLNEPVICQRDGDGVVESENRRRLRRLLCNRADGENPQDDDGKRNERGRYNTARAWKWGWRASWTEAVHIVTRIERCKHPATCLASQVIESNVRALEPVASCPVLSLGSALMRAPGRIRCPRSVVS